MSLIIVEGPDNTGKTTLIDSLYYHIKKRRSVSFTKSIPPWRDKIRAENWLELCLSGAENNDEVLITDRFSPISELIYATTIRDRAPIWGTEKMEPFLGLPVVIIHTTRTMLQIKESWDERAQIADGKTIRESDISKLIKMYYDVMEGLASKFYVIRYDYSTQLGMIYLYDELIVNAFNNPEVGK